MSTERASWDPGAQPERTGMAWQRTGLSGLGCSLVVAKLVGGHSVVLGAVLAALAILTTTGMFLVSRRRYRKVNDALFDDRPLPDGRLFGAVVSLIVLTGIGAAVYAVIQLELG